MMRICCIGGGYVGGPSGAIIANKVPSAKVTVVDVDHERIAAWNSNVLPIYESGLRDLVVVARDGISGQREPNLFFTTAVDEAIQEADLIFVSVNTPTKTSGLGAGKASDLGWLEMAMRRIARCAVHNTIVVQKSTVPCGTAQNMLEILRANARAGVNFEALSNPEFLAEGTAVENLLFPDRVLVGHFETEAGTAAADSLVDIYANWIPRAKIIKMKVHSAELAKLASNALLAQRISSINALSSICEVIGADIQDVSYACGLDNRIGPKMLNASVGFGGSCFKKDILNLSYMSESLNLPQVASYWQSVNEVNDYQKARFIRKIVDTMHSTLSRKKVAVLGFAYKKNTGDTRESAAISVVKKLLAENAIVAIYDPLVQHEQIYRDLQLKSPSVDCMICSDPYEACNNAHAVLILTEWDMFSNKALATPLSAPKAKRFWREHITNTLEDTPKRVPNQIEIDSGYGSEHSPSLNASSLEDDIRLDESPLIEEAAEPHADTATTTTSQEIQSKRLDWSRVASMMQRPMHVFDGRNIIDATDLRCLGFHVLSIGSSLVDTSTGRLPSSLIT